MRVQMLVLPLLVAVSSLVAQSARAGEDFYWKDSYGRGVGTVPPEACGSGKENDAGLCYNKCEKGYHGVGPVCWSDNQESYGRGVGTIPHLHLVKHHGLQEACSSGKEKDAGLCYDVCKSGYHGVGPVCWSDSAASHPRGAGTMPNFVCGSGKEKDAGLCYATCRSGYHGVGPVCWGETPSGYVDCGFGYASSKDQCALTTTNQTLAVAMLLGTACGDVFPPCGAAMNDLKAAAQEKMGKLSAKSLESAKAAGKAIKEQLEPLLTKVGDIFKKVAKGEKGVGDAVKEAEAAVKDDLTPSKLAVLEKILTEDGPKAFKAGNKGYKGGNAVAGLAKSDEVLDTLRDATNLVSSVITLEGIANPAMDTPASQGISNTCNVVGAYMYPVYGK